jgi:hypothetical protein
LYLSLSLFLSPSIPLSLNPCTPTPTLLPSPSCVGVCVRACAREVFVCMRARKHTHLSRASPLVLAPH